jgi:hypothetical protein
LLGKRPWKRYTEYVSQRLAARGSFAFLRAFAEELRASIKRMELSQMRSSEAVSDALEELEKVEFCLMLLKYKST